MSLTVLIVEDDPQIRQIIKRTAGKIPGVEVVGEAGGGVKALKMYEALRPKVVTIDIDIPEKNGLELARDIFDVNPWTYIVFCTGFPEFRDKAFEIYAFDYLVKPFKMERIKQTLSRIMAIDSSRTGNAGGSGFEIQQKSLVKGSKLFRDADRYLMIDFKDIIFITRENRKTTVHYFGGKIYTDETLSSLEEQLRGQMFYRSHKGFLINLNMVRELVPCGKSTYQVVMANTLERPLMTWEKLRELENMTRVRKGR
ncbi:MAG: LytR/AlgR family response regulator transcription factor [Bacillota bacterium]